MIAMIYYHATCIDNRDTCNWFKDQHDGDGEFGKSSLCYQFSFNLVIVAASLKMTTNFNH